MKSLLSRLELLDRSQRAATGQPYQPVAVRWNFHDGDGERDGQPPDRVLYLPTTASTEDARDDLRSALDGAADEEVAGITGRWCARWDAEWRQPEPEVSPCTAD